MKIDAAMRLDAPARPLDVSASHRLFSLRASTDATPSTAGRRSAALEIGLPDLAPFAALGGQDVHGSATVKAQLRGDGGTASLTLDASSALVVGREFWSGAVGDRASLQLSGSLTERAITIENMKFNRPFAVGERRRRDVAAARDSRGRLQNLRARWELGVTDLKTLAPVLAARCGPPAP